MKPLKSIRLFLFSLVFWGACAPYPVSVHVLRSPQGCPVVLVGDVHFETEGLTAPEQELVDFVSQAIKNGAPLNLVWEKIGNKREEYKGNILFSYGKLQGDQVLEYALGSRDVVETFGLFELSNQILDMLSSQVSCHVNFHGADPRAKGTVFCESNDSIISMRLLIKTFNEMKLFERAVGLYALPSETLSVQERYNDLMWKRKYCEWRDAVWDRLDCIVTKMRQQAQARGKCLLSDSNIEYIERVSRELTDYSFAYHIVKSKSPVLLYAGAAHSHAVQEILTCLEFGYEFIEGVGVAEQIGIHERPVVSKTILPKGIVGNALNAHLAQLQQEAQDTVSVASLNALEASYKKKIENLLISKRERRALWEDALRIIEQKISARLEPADQPKRKREVEVSDAKRVRSDDAGAEVES
jgi:hypothetical protein